MFRQCQIGFNKYFPSSLCFAPRCIRLSLLYLFLIFHPNDVFTHNVSFSMCVGVIDKTAEFVAKNGRALEERILIAESSNPKFGFMRAGNVYFAYYQLRMRDYRRSIEAPNDGSAESSSNTGHNSSRILNPSHLFIFGLYSLFSIGFTP
jgi:hypothetical protein